MEGQRERDRERKRKKGREGGGRKDEEKREREQGEHFGEIVCASESWSLDLTDQLHEQTHYLCSSDDIQLNFHHLCLYSCNIISNAVTKIILIKCMFGSSVFYFCLDHGLCHDEACKRPAIVKH